MAKSIYNDIYGVPTAEEFISSASNAFKSNVDPKMLESMFGGDERMNSALANIYANQYGSIAEKIADQEAADLKTVEAQQFNKMMEDSKYQRLTQDLEASGINPLYAVNGATASAGNGVGAAQSNMSNITTAKEQLKISNKLATAQANAATMQGVASLIGAVGSLAGGMAGAAHNFGLTTAKGAIKSVVDGNYTSIIRNISNLFD